MIKNRLSFFYLLCIIVLIVINIPFSNLSQHPRFLNFFAEYYFDEDYYLKNYPEIKNSNIKPFEHYIKYGWNEGKKPNDWFENDFYKKIYLYKNKYNLNPLASYVMAKIAFTKQLTNHNQLLPVKLLDNPKYYISLVAVFQNESRFLKEWIEFYRLMGVEHFYLYNHQSSDNYQEILEPYIKIGLVDLRQVTGNPTNLEEWNDIQKLLYTNTAKEIKDITEWLIVVDTDEFLFPVKDNNLKQLLQKYDNYASLSVNWKLFGTGGIERIPENKLMIETLVKSSDTESGLLKNIVKPRYVKGFGNPHFPNLIFGYTQVTENYEHFVGAYSPTESYNIVRINHYWTRDLEFFKTNKLSRVHLVKTALTEKEKEDKINELIEQDHQMSIKYDDAILRFVPDLRRSMKLNEIE